ncbi:MAG: hypothetical protein GX166_12995 [Clostridiaceae bacterium]|nr:hypothetical protein [Clostridiaceae bacterium]
MAKKINVKLILELRAANMTRNMIAATRHISKNSVSDVFHIADSQGISIRDVQEHKIQRLTQQSKLRLPRAEVHDIYYDGRGLNRDAIQELSSSICT